MRGWSVVRQIWTVAPLTSFTGWAIMLLYTSINKEALVVTYAGGDFTGLGLTAMVCRLVSAGIELCLDSVQRRANEQDTEAGIDQDWRSDLSELREALLERNYKPGTIHSRDRRK